MPERSRRPYLLRAMHEWMIDCGYTPQVIVDAARNGVEVPKAFVKDNRIVLNLSPQATQNLALGNEWLMFSARFSGVVHQVQLPADAVLGIYARETGQGMVFPEEGDGTPTPTDPVTPPDDRPNDSPPPPEPRARPQLKIVK